MGAFSTFTIDQSHNSGAKKNKGSCIFLILYEVQYGEV